jgi:hypothetical protein
MLSAVLLSAISTKCNRIIVKLKLIMLIQHTTHKTQDTSNTQHHANANTRSSGDSGLRALNSNSELGTQFPVAMSVLVLQSVVANVAWRGGGGRRVASCELPR